MCCLDWTCEKGAENWRNDRLKIKLFRQKLRKLPIYKCGGYNCMLLCCSHLDGLKLLSSTLQNQPLL